MAASGCTAEQIAVFVREHVPIGVSVSPDKLSKRRLRQIENKAAWSRKDKAAAVSKIERPQRRAASKAASASFRLEEAMRKAGSQVSTFEAALASVKVMSPADALILLGELEALERSATG